MPSVAVPPSLHEVPASHRLVYLVVAGAEAAPSVEELIDRTGLSRSSVKTALVTLSERGLVEEQTHPVDGRRRLYALAEDDAAVTSAPAPS
jgi:DNA-binding MarR family transcriptional regulator